jgi:hypothetical protein
METQETDDGGFAVIEVDVRVRGHSSGETDEKDEWFSVTLVGDSIGLEVRTVKLTLKGDNGSLFTSYPIGKIVSVKLHDPQRKLSEASE